MEVLVEQRLLVLVGRSSLWLAGAGEAKAPVTGGPRPPEERAVGPVRRAAW